MMKWLLCLILITTHPLKANLNEKLNNFFDKAGASVNVSSGEIYQGQKAGYMTGGGVVVRGRVIDTKPLTVSLPKFDAGCGGIDIFTGGFTFIDNKQLIETLKSIGSSAVGYAFLLGLKSVSPLVSGTIENLQTWANHINTFNINSCEIAQAAVGSVWPKRTMASQEICRRISSGNGQYTSYAAGRHGCAQEKNFDEKMTAGDKLPGYLREEINIAWESIQKQSYLANDPQLAEFFMSLMGTMIFRKDDKGITPERKLSKIRDASFLQAMLEGGKTTIYACSDRQTNNHCLRVHEQEIDFSSSHSWLGRVKDQLLSIQEKILSDEELSTDEKTLLANSRLPLYKIINVLTAYKKGKCPVDLYHIAEVVAIDLLCHFLGEAIEIVREGTLQFKNEKMYVADDINDFLEELKLVESKVRYYETHSMQLFERELLLIQKIQMIEDQLRAELSFN